MGLLKDLFSVWLGCKWGTMRLPDGRGLFYPWLVTRLVYLVPSDELYTKIRRSMILWGLLFFFGGAILGPLAINVLVVKPKDPSGFLIVIEAAVCLLPLILLYIRWARKVTRSLPLFDSRVVNEALDPTAAPTYEESVRRNLAPYSLSLLYAAGIFSLGFTIVCIYVGIREPQEWVLWFGAVFFGACSVGMIFAIRIKRRMPKCDFL
jgi:hypothetical protein